MQVLCPDIRPGVPLNRQAADHLRRMIVSGELPVGTRLPAAQTLAEHWKSNTFTVHKALSSLVKEGLLSRRPRVGTIVAARRPALHSVGIYCDGRYLASGREQSYTLAVLAALQTQLAERSVQITLWMDPRPEREQRKPWPALNRIIRNRRIQGLIAPLVNDCDLTWLRKLPVPLACHRRDGHPGEVHSDLRGLVAMGVRQLARRGCRRIGILSTVEAEAEAGKTLPPDLADYYQHFQQLVVEHGLETRPQWICAPRSYQYAKEKWGYERFRQLWSEAEHPEGLIVFSDVAVRGVVTAILERRVSVPQELKLVMHRNREVGLVCPLPADWVEFRAVETADALVAQLERQLAGEPANPIVLPAKLIEAESSDTVGEEN
jgi:DNA-binding LacI/PurR family transcriptional regulator